MRRRRDEAVTTLDDLFETLESMQLRVLETLGDELVDEPLLAAEPELDLDTILFAAVDTAVEMEGADAALATTFADGGLYAANGLTDEEAVTYAVGPPPVGPSVRALAIAYEGDGESCVQMALAVPILSGEETIGFLSVYTRSAEVVFDEEQGRYLQEIAAAAAARIDALLGPAQAPAAAAEPEPEADTEIVAAPRVPRSRTRLALLSVAAAACVAAPLLMAAGIHSGLRVAAALVLMTLAPGAAVWPLFGSRRPELELGLVVGTSIGVSVLVAEGTLWAGAWSPQRSTVVLALVSLVSIVAQLGRQVVPPRAHWSAT